MSVSRQWLIIFCCLPVWTWATEPNARAVTVCPPVGDNPDPVIDVRLTQHIPLYEEDSSKTRAEIEQLTGKPDSEGAFSARGVKFLIRGDATARTTRSSFCVWVTKIDADITVTSLTIYAAEEYPKGSCRYDEIMDHEHEHYRTFTWLLGIYTQRLRSGIEQLDLPTSAQPWSVSTVEEGKQRIQSLFDGVARSENDRFWREYNRRTDEFHERESHRQTRCRQ